MIIAYLRVSTEKQHLENQHNEIVRFVEQKGLSVDRWVTEIVSGRTRKDERKLGRLLQSMKSGDVLIVTELSRLSRSLHEVMAIMGRCLDKKITVYSTKDGYAFDDSINSKVLSFAFGLVAEIERNLISQRTREALALRKAEGVILGRREGDAPKMRQLEHKKENIIEWIQHQMSIAEICRHLQVSVETFRLFRKMHEEVDRLLRERYTPKQRIDLEKKAAFLKELQQIRMCNKKQKSDK